MAAVHGQGLHRPSADSRCAVCSLLAENGGGKARATLQKGVKASTHKSHLGKVFPPPGRGQDAWQSE